MQVSNIISQTGLSRLDVEVLLAHILDESKEWLFANSDFEVSESQLKKFHEFEKQRLEGKSVAAILGKKEFFGLDFLVDKNVLIPRPETELLVEEILKLSPKSLLDIGTGSGCIAVAVAKHLSGCRVVASDVSEKALVVARKNAQLLSAEVELIESDLLENISENFEVIAANLPYIPEDSRDVQKSVVDFEPAGALFAGHDGLDLIRKLLQQIAEMLQKPKFVLLEFGGKAQKNDLKRLTQELFPNSLVEFCNDLAGHPRVLKMEGL